MGFPDDDAPDAADLLRVVPRLYDRTRQQVALAQRMLGALPCLLGISGQERSTEVDPELAGLPDADERVDVLSVLDDESAPTTADERPTAAPSSTAPPSTAPPATTPPATPPPATAPPAAPDETTLPIQDYDSMAASQVVPRLTTLSVAELEAVRRYEQAHRSRQTILNRVAQLLDS